LDETHKRGQLWLELLNERSKSRHQDLVIHTGGFPALKVGKRSSRFDIIIAGGNHAFPRVHSLFDLVLASLKINGILVLPNIDIPTTHDLFEFLSQDSGFTLHLTMEQTAFFQRSGINISNDWRAQSYNLQHFPAFDPNKYSRPFTPPFEVLFTGHLNSHPQELIRGFRILNGMPITEGSYSVVSFPVQSAGDGPYMVKVGVEALGLSARPDAALEVRIGSAAPQLHRFQTTPFAELCAELPDLPGDTLTVGFVNHGLINGIALDNLPHRILYYLQPGIRLLSVSVKRKAESEGFVSSERRAGQIVRFSHHKEEFRFFVQDCNDSIQSHHYVGEFYEREELSLIEKYIEAGSKVIDVGANIGNHTVYFKKICKAELVIPIELQPEAIELLRLNVLLNNLQNVDLRFLGVGLGASSHRACINIPQSFNVAGATFKPSRDGAFQIVRADDILRNQRPNFVKIDVEGMECDVVEGMTDIISASRPSLFVEVWNENRDRFDELMNKLGYTILDEFRRYDVATNLICESKTKACL